MSSNKLKLIDNFEYLNCKLWKTFLNKLEALIWSIELTVGIENITITNNPTTKTINKFVKENTLLGQALITDPKKSVSEFISEVSKNNNISLNITSMDLYTI